MSFTAAKSAAGRGRRALTILVIVEVAYLALANGLLNLSFTQTVVNLVRPEKFHVTWERAWTWYPFHFHARGIAANGQSRSQQWQLRTPEASGSIAVLPLLFKRVWISDVRAVDIDYRQRPRLQPGRDYTAVLPYFSAIEGREVTAAITTPRKKKRPWKISVEDARASGRHAFWVYNFRGSGEGGMVADFSYETPGGPFSLDGTDLDLALGPLYVNGGREVFRRGAVRGDLGFDPFVPREHKDLSLLEFLLLDAELDLESDSLAFINVFIAALDDVTVGGSGHVAGRVLFERGRVLPGTGLAVESSDLAVQLLALTVAGQGRIDLTAEAETPERIQLDFNFGELTATADGDDSPLLVGEDLDLLLRASSRLNLAAETVSKQGAVGFTIRDLEVPDLALLQRYLPLKWPLQLYGGSGILQGDLLLEPQSLRVDLALDSDAAQVGIRDYHFTSNLDAALKLENPAMLSERTRIGGSFIRLGDSRLANGGNVSSEPWEASLEFTHGYLGILSDEAKAGQRDFVGLLRQLGTAESRKLLGDCLGLIGFEASVSSLGWISVLLGEQHHATVQGNGTMAGEIRLAGGWPEAGTEVRVWSPSLDVGFLDYQGQGDGSIELRVVEGGETPDWRVDIALADAGLKRRGQRDVAVEDVDLSLRALVKDVSIAKRQRDYELQLNIASARVADMSVFNAYLPPDNPLQIAGGTAELTSSISLQPDAAAGWVSLVSRGLRARVDDQAFTGDLVAEVPIVGGSPRDMVFDVSGARLRLDKVSVAGDRESFDREDWSVSVTLDRAETAWVTPLEFSADVSLRISDSRPVVALFQNQGYRPKWLAELLTLEDIDGGGRIDVADNRIVIPLARVLSDKAEVAAKAVIAQESRDGVIYARYKKLDALLAISGDRRNLDLIRVRKKFDDYKVVPLASPIAGRR